MLFLDLGGGYMCVHFMKIFELYILVFCSILCVLEFTVKKSFKRTPTGLLVKNSCVSSYGQEKRSDILVVVVFKGFSLACLVKQRVYSFRPSQKLWRMDPNPLGMPLPVALLRTLYFILSVMEILWRVENRGVMWFDFY